MNRVAGTTRSLLRRTVLRSTEYEGSDGTVWFGGSEQRAPSIAAYFCGDDVQLTSQGRVLRRNLPDRIAGVAAAGGLPILRLHDHDPHAGQILQRATTVPALIDIYVDLPGDVEALRSQLKTSTTREDFRRIRRAGFTYRVTSDPDAVREFHAEHYLPSVNQRFPDDGAVRSLEEMVGDLDRGAELVCADLDGTWVAGMLNIRGQTEYTMMSLGIRDASNEVRQKRVVAALIIRSLERAVELGNGRATLGRSVPFLGKGPVWFKAKWGGVLTTNRFTRYLYMFLDVRHAAVRRMLAASPIIHVVDDELVVSTWLEAGEEPLRVTTRDAGRFPGVARWYVLGEPETLAAGEASLSESDRIVAMPVTPCGDDPLWLSDVLPGRSGLSARRTQRRASRRAT